jgi:lipopolysaccharide biosynthesis glycosyltransferase
VAQRQSRTSRRLVAVALDDNMVWAMCVLLSSLWATKREPFSLIVGFFSGKLSPRNLRIVQSHLDFLGVGYDIRELTAHPLFTERRHLTITTFSKFVISDQVPDPHLWLDLDIVAKEGWDDFFDTLLKPSLRSALVVAEKIDSEFTRFEGFNAGVLGWTGQPRLPWVLELANLPEKRFSSEQHLFNTLYRDSYTTVDVRFNFLSSWHKHTEDLQKASLIHYSGPVKPWHLARRHHDAWDAINASWRHWFFAENQMMAGNLPDSLRKDLVKLRRAALFSGRLHTGKGSLAGLVLRVLAVLGPLGDPLVWWLGRRAR